MVYIVCTPIQCSLTPVYSLMRDGTSEGAGVSCCIQKTEFLLLCKTFMKVPAKNSYSFSDQPNMGEDDRR